jgi:hypothetical protein
VRSPFVRSAIANPLMVTPPASTETRVGRRSGLELLGPSPDTSIILRSARMPAGLNNRSENSSAAEIEVPASGVSGYCSIACATASASAGVSTIVQGTMTR